MPMDRSLYPEDWEAIALAIKEESNWTCEECGRPCRQPGESRPALCTRIETEHPKWAGDLYELGEDEESMLIAIPKLTRFTLTVAHLDHVPENCDRSNLRALCAPCHCRYDLKAMATKKRLKAERLGQLTIKEL